MTERYFPACLVNHTSLATTGIEHTHVDQVNAELCIVVSFQALDEPR